MLECHRLIGSDLTVSCTIWDGRETKKAEMSVLDISSAIIERVEAIPETCDYIYIGLAFSIVLALVPAFCRLCEVSSAHNQFSLGHQNNVFLLIPGPNQLIRIDRIEFFRYARFVAGENTIFM